jgi:hypothetical protein
VLLLSYSVLGSSFGFGYVEIESYKLNKSPSVNREVDAFHSTSSRRHTVMKFTLTTTDSIRSSRIRMSEFCGVGATYGFPHGKMTRCHLLSVRMESFHATMGMCGMLPGGFIKVIGPWYNPRGTRNRYGF